MKTKVLFKVLDVIMIFMMAFGSPLSALAAPSPTGATITSDLADYNPGGTVTLTGAGWAAGESVHIVVNDTIGQTWQRIADVTASDTGNFTDVFNLPNYFVSDYDVTATGAISGAATTTFTDANPSADLDQCANDPSPSPSTDGCNTNANEWVNGNLNEAKSVYLEGDSIPYRLKFGSLSLASHTVTIEWDTTKDDKHAIDYLTTFSRTVANANPCLGVSGCTFPGSPSTFAIPMDPQVTGGGVTPVAGNFTLYGGTITAVSAYSYPDGTGFLGTKTARITITFTASQPNPVLAWGGHIATRADWGSGNSAVAISGSPYHTALIDLDGSGGNQDRSLSADAVIFPGSITVVKDATPNGSTSFGFTASPLPLSDFSLVDDGTSANTRLFSGITTFTTYTVNESSIPAGWGFDSVSCSVTSGNGGSYTTNTTTVDIDMKEGENWTCTYLDSQRTGTLTVIKHVVNDNGGSATADQWSIHVTTGGSEVTGSPQAGAESPGTNYTLTGGTYNVSETGGPSDYTFTGFSGDCDSNGDVTLAAGESKTCTLTNDDNAPALYLVKHVVNNNGGQAIASAWTLSAGANSVTGSETGALATSQTGTYALSESSVDGYSNTSITCSDDPGVEVTSVTLGLGETITCTFVNDDNAPALYLVKHVINDNGGEALASAWTLSAGANSVTGSEAGALATDQTGTYALSESSVDGYSNTSITCSDDPGVEVTSVTLGLGETKTCTFVNDDNAPALYLVKHVVNDNGGTAEADAWTLSAGSNSVTGSEAGALATDQTGTYALSESSVDGYSNTSITCSDDPGVEVTSVTLGLGETKTCTFVNDDIAPELMLTKVVYNNNGGTALASEWTLTAAGDGGFSGTGLQGSLENYAVNGPHDVKAGVTYTLSESGPSGYTASDWMCRIDGGDWVTGDSITLGLDEFGECQIFNDDNAPALYLVKHVVNNNGGEALASAWTLSAGANSVTGSEAGALATDQTGTYDLSETDVDGYTNTSITCSDDPGVEVTSVTLGLGETKTCIFVNDDNAPALYLVKHVVNDSGGEALASAWTLSAGANSVTGSEAGALATDQTGTYALSESSVDGYSNTSITCSDDPGVEVTSVTLGLGETKTCTFVNDDIAPELMLTKVVYNDNGGTALASEWTLTAAGDGGFSGTGLQGSLENYAVNGPHDVKAGVTYALSESGPSGYTASDWMCRIDGGDWVTGDSITLGLDELGECQIFNDDNAPALYLVKHVVNNNGGQAIASAWTLSAGSNSVTGSEAGALATDQAGTYDLSETDVDGYTNTSITCSDDPGVEVTSVTLGLGETITCTFVNDDDAPALYLVKHVVNDSGGQAIASAWTLSAGSNSVTGSEAGALATDQAGTYDLSETDVDGYTNTSITCSDDPGVEVTSVTLGLGETITCTFVNDDIAPTLTVIKVLIPDTDTGTFNLQIDGTTYATGADGTTTGAVAVNAGSHTVGETGAGGTVLSDYVTVISGDCAADGSITLGLAENKTCTITNTKKGMVDLLKITNGSVHPELDIKFTLYRDGPDTDPDLTGTDVQLEELSTLNDADGLLEFTTKLVPGTTYTICENPVPAGWTSMWMIGFSVNGTIVTPYNPNANDIPMQDVGIRCFDFTVEPGETLHFEVHNDFPGGDPRTIGYWKNWNRCTGGGQAANAAKNGGAAAGFFLVEDLLPQLIGDLNVMTCQQAVKVLDKSDQSGKKKANDAAYELAAQLLAAKLNLAAGAQTCTAVQQAVINGQALLDTINFTGSGDYLGSKVKGAKLQQRTQALALATTLDQYNNGNLCP